MNILVLMVIVVIGVTGLVFLVKFLNSKGVKVDEIVSEVKSAEEIAVLVLDSIPVSKDEKFQITKILDIASKAAEFVGQFNGSPSKDAKIKLAIDAAQEAFKTLGVVPTDSQQQLIKAAITKTIDAVDKIVV